MKLVESFIKNVVNSQTCFLSYKRIKLKRSYIFFYNRKLNKNWLFVSKNWAFHNSDLFNIYF